MQFTKIVDGKPEDSKTVLFMVIDDTGKYDFAPGYKKESQFFFPQGYPMAPDINPVEWADLPPLPVQCKYSWE